MPTITDPLNERELLRRTPDRPGQADDSFLFQLHPRMPNSFAGMRVRSAAAVAVQMQLPHECLYVSPHSVQINRIDTQEDARPTALS